MPCWTAPGPARHVNNNSKLARGLSSDFRPTSGEPIGGASHDITKRRTARELVAAAAGSSSPGIARLSAGPAARALPRPTRSSSIRPRRPSRWTPRWPPPSTTWPAQFAPPAARGAAVMLIYGAHLLRNGAALILDRMMADGWLTHLATNGAGTIHDWEYAWLGRSTESVRDGVAQRPLRHLGRDGPQHPPRPAGGGLDGPGLRPGPGPIHRRRRRHAAANPRTLEEAIRREPGASAHRRAGRTARWPCGEHARCRRAATPSPHRWKQASILAAAFRHDVPITVHPGIGYDIITNHPMFNGAAIGRAAQRDFAQFSAAVEGSTAAWSSRSAPRSWARRSSRRA